ncbi:MAG TPA: Na+/H+ antiporter NhaA [Steroidobacteraceae bacterium]|nr:Na+/H+ antiporter NhaA [Steroidobacteraceae bacterium]
MARSYLTALTRPLLDFLRTESAGGLVLMAATVAAMLVANSAVGPGWAGLLEQHVRVGAGGLALDKSLMHWINDALMVLFFIVVGLELKREMVMGHLSSWRTASLPAVAALGGMVAPALVYTAFNHDHALAMRGWAIPTATDIAFALGVLSLLGSRVPTGLKAFLLSIAIFDDLGAIVIIALFYTDQLSLAALGIAALLLACLAGLNLAGVRRLAPYLILGAGLWLAVLKSGVHATLAGVMLAMCIPLREAGGRVDPQRSPLLWLERLLHPWVVFIVLPLFALANAAIPLAGVTGADLLHPVPVGIALGLLLGKPVGILLFTWLAVRAGICETPRSVGWLQITGMSLLCGIGFTMSLFIAQLAFVTGVPVHAGLERMGILAGTLASGVLGYLWLRLVPAPPPDSARP